jgi:hypothetical protein
MAIDFKSNINLGKNQLQNALLHPTATAPSSPSEGQVYFDTTAGDKKLYVYDGTNWIDLTGDIRDVSAGTGISVSVSSGDATVSLSHLGLESLTDPNADRILFWDDSEGATKFLSASSSTGITIDGTSLKLASIPNASLTNSSLTVTAGSGLTDGGAISLGGSATINVGAGTGISVAADAVAVKGASGLTDDTIVMWDDSNGQFIDSPISDDGTNINIGSSRNLTVAGNLTVSGTTTTVNSNTVNIGDAMLTLNSDLASDTAPSEDAGIEVNRGSSTNKKLYWDETLDAWRADTKFIIDGTVDYGTVSTSTKIFAQKVHATDKELQTTTVANIGTALGVGLYSVELSATYTNVTKSGNTYTVGHGLGTKLVQVQVVDSTNYETVFVEVARTTTNAVEVRFAQTVTDGDYICMVSSVANLDTTTPAPEN